MKSWLAGVLLMAGLHHPVASIYELSKTATVEGRILEVQIRNPHSFLTIEVVGKDGKKTVWAGEWGKASAMSQIGVSSSTFKPGDSIVVIGHPPISRNAQERLLIRSVIRPADGIRWNMQTQ